ncbi:hypothetical protein GP486_008611, partial [Trichoglossum hirsutum]
SIGARVPFGQADPSAREALHRLHTPGTAVAGDPVTDGPTPFLGLTDAHDDSQVVSGKPPDTSVRKYAKYLTHTSKRLVAQVTILHKEKKNLESILKKRQKQRSGKKAAVEGHFMLSTAEIRDNVQVAEKEMI